MDRVELSPQRTTVVGTMSVSSIHYRLGRQYLNETCVFNLATDNSAVVGTYDDHDMVVRMLSKILPL